jgi:hypothetical protein
LNRRERRAQRAQGRHGNDGPKPPYPLVACSHYKGDPLPGYAVCVHARNDTSLPVTVERATRENLGTVLCTACSEHPDLPVEHLVTACAHFVADNFGVPL